MYNENVQQIPICEASCVTKEIPISPRFSSTIIHLQASSALYSSSAQFFISSNLVRRQKIESSRRLELLHRKPHLVSKLFPMEIPIRKSPAPPAQKTCLPPPYQKRCYFCRLQPEIRSVSVVCSLSVAPVVQYVTSKPSDVGT